MSETVGEPRARRASALRATAAVALLALIACASTALFHHRVLLGGQTFQMVGNLGRFPSDPSLGRVVADPLASSGQFEPWLDHLLRERNSHGRTPLWNPYQGTGAPFLANAQSAVFHPLRYLQQILPPGWRLDIAVLIRIALAWLGMALLCRVIGLSFTASLLGGCAFAFSGYFQYFANMVHLGVEALLPWHLLAIEMAMRGRARSGAALFGASVALSHLGGFPESTALCLLVALAYGLVRLASRARARTVVLTLALAAAGLLAGRFLLSGLRWGDGASAWLALCALVAALTMAGPFGRRFTLRFGAAALLGTLLAAPQILPFLEYLGRCVHLHDSHRLVGLTARPWSSFFGTLVANLRQFGSGLNPPFHFDEPPAVGIATAILALTAVLGLGLRRARSAPAVFFALVTFLATAKLFNAPFIAWVGTLPPLREIILRKYLGVVIALGFAGLAACGLDVWSRGRSPRPLLGIACAAALALLVHRILGLHLPLDARWLGATPVLVLAVFLGAALGALFLRANRRPWLALISVALLATTTAELYRYAPRRRGSRAAAAAQPVGLEDHLGALREQRILGTWGVFPPNWSTRYAIQDLRLLDAMVNAGYHRLLDAFFGLPLRDRWDGPRPEGGALDLEKIDDLGVRYLLVDRPWLPRLQSPPVETAVRGGDTGIARGTGGQLHGLHLPGNSALFLGPLIVPREDSADLVIRATHSDLPPRVHLHVLGPRRAVFRTPRVSIQQLRRDYPGRIANLSIPAGQGGLEPDIFAGRPVLAEFRPLLNGRTLNAALLQVRNVRWDGKRLRRESFARAQRITTDLVPDEFGQRLLDMAFGPPNRLWLEPARETVLRCRLELNFDLPGEVTPEDELQIRIDARPILSSSELKRISISPGQLRLDLGAHRGELLYLQLDLAAGAELWLHGVQQGERSTHLRLVSQGPISVLENRRARPIAYLVHRAERVAPAELSRRLRAPDLRLHELALVSGSGAHDLDSSAPIAEPPVRMRRPCSDELVLQVQPHAPALLVVLETYDPGWRVKVDGREVPLIRVFGAFRGVYLEDGDRRVVMSYAPAAYLWGRILASCAAALALAWIAWPLLAGARRPEM